MQNSPLFKHCPLRQGVFFAMRRKGNNVARSSLEYIDHRVQEALESTTVPPSLQMLAGQRGRITVAGFAVNDPRLGDEAVEKGMKTRQERATQCRRDRVRVESALKQYDITPLAVIPKTAWDAICLRSGLFRLAPDKDGEIGIDPSLITQSKDHGSYIVDACVFFSSLLIGVTMGFVASMRWGFPVWGFLLTGGLCGILSFIAQALTHDLVLHKRPERAMAIRALRQATSGEWSKVLKALLPDGQNVKGSDLKVKVILPEAPADVQAVLLKARTFTLKVAAVPEAIGLDLNADFLMVEFERVQEAQRRAAQRDPIIYYDDGNVVAILAQFGEFPVEQAVVDEVLSVEFLSI